MDRKRTILIVDDDPAAAEELKELVADIEGVRPACALSGAAARKIIEREPLAAALVDYLLPDTNGIELLKEIRGRDADVPVIIITGVGSIESGVEAMKAGAHDYILKPFQPEKIRALVAQLVAYQELREENAALREELGVRYSLNQPVGKSLRIKKIYDLLPDIAQTDSTVLIRGESGTGKELLAKSIHAYSHRRDGPFIVADCTALSESLLESELFGHEKGAFTGAIKKKTGRFEQAHGGSIFLDEIGAFPASAQLKLLRFLQERAFERVGGEETIKVDVRVITATNQDLEKMVREGSFREDLYYRVNVILLALPPLRERKEDIPLLARHFIDQFSRKNRKEIRDIDPETLRQLIDYDWPGNIRELQNMLERAVVVSRGNILKPEDLPGAIRGGEKPPATLSLQENERSIIVKALLECGYNIFRTAGKLGISRSTLYSKAKKLGIGLK